MKVAFKSEVPSYGLNITELLKHVLNARRIEHNYYWSLFFLGILGVVSFIARLKIEEVQNRYDPSLGDIPDLYVQVSLMATILFFVCVALIPIVVIMRNLNRRRFLKDNFYRSDYNKDFRYKKKNRSMINSFLKRTGLNVLVYSGFSPFAGSGQRVGGWSFVVDHTIGKGGLMEESSEPLEFMLSDVYERVEKEISTLQMKNLIIKDVLLVNGQDIRFQKEFLPDKLSQPIAEISEERINDLRDKNLPGKRVYKLIQVLGWGGDVVLSAYFRISKGNDGLFIENNYHLLHPIQEKYKAIDSRRDIIGIWAWCNWLFGMLLLSVFDLVLSVFMAISYIIVSWIAFWGFRKRRLRKLVATSPNFDYGAQTSIREMVSDNRFTQHFQVLDVEKYMKTVEKRILNAIGDFLDEKNISTSDFRQRESFVLNKGVIVSGGSFQAKSMSFGEKIRVNLGFGKRENEEK